MFLIVDLGQFLRVILRTPKVRFIKKSGKYISTLTENIFQDFQGT